MSVEMREGVPESEALWRLFLTTGWNEEYRLSPGQLREAFEASWYVAAAYEAGRLVGVGRLVSDGVVHAMVYDLIVAPERQGTGIGGLLLERLLQRCQREGLRDIQLFSARGKRPFYEKRGFVARPEDAPGMQYARKRGTDGGGAGV